MVLEKKEEVTALEMRLQALDKDLDWKKEVTAFLAIKVYTNTVEPVYDEPLYSVTSPLGYRIYSINRPGRLLNFWTLRVGAYSRWALIRGWALIKFSPFSASEVCLFCNKTINANNKTRRSNKARFLYNTLKKT